MKNFEMYYNVIFVPVTVTFVVNNFSFILSVD